MRLARVLPTAKPCSIIEARVQELRPTAQDDRPGSNR